jgi:hypothetical protein
MCHLSFRNSWAVKRLRVLEMVSVIQVGRGRRWKELVVEGVTLSLAGAGNTMCGLQLWYPCSGDVGWVLRDVGPGFVDRLCCGVLDPLVPVPPLLTSGCFVVFLAYLFCLKLVSQCRILF